MVRSRCHVAEVLILNGLLMMCERRAILNPPANHLCSVLDLMRHLLVEALKEHKLLSNSSPQEL